MAKAKKKAPPQGLVSGKAGTRRGSTPKKAGTGIKKAKTTTAAADKTKVRRKKKAK